ncbi:MAG: hypothetical protein AAFY71_20850 [Bacteroidota bacterium]
MKKAFLRGMLMCLCMGFFLHLSAQCPQPEPGIQLCGSDEFCAQDSVCIEITADSGSSYSFFLIDWNGDLIYDDTVNQPGVQFHVYNLPNGCTEPVNQVIWVQAVNVCGSVSSDASVAALVKIVPPPVITNLFGPSDPSTLCCPNHSMDLELNACPNTDNSVLVASWDFGPSASPQFVNVLDPPVVDYPAGAGFYPVTLTLETQADGVSCGVTSFTDTLEIYEPPLARDTLLDDLNPSPDSMLFCLGAPAVILNTSLFASDTSNWNIFPNSGYTVTVINEDSLVINFSQAGTYTIRLDAISLNCGIDQKSTTLVIEEPPQVDFITDLNTIIDCNPVTLSPGDSLPPQPSGVILTWDLGIHGTFTGNNPGTFTYPNSDQIIVSGGNQCGLRVDTLDIQIVPPSNGQINVPSTLTFLNDTIYVCRDDIPFALMGMPAGGNLLLDGLPAGVSIDPAGLSPLVSHLVTYGNSCIEADTVHIVVEDFTVGFTIDSVLCVDGPIQSFQASLANGLIGNWGGGA